METSTLLTVELPSFDSITGQLSSTQHHLISTPTSYINALPSCYVKFSLPPSKPYQTSDNIEEDEEANADGGDGDDDDEDVEGEKSGVKRKVTAKSKAAAKKKQKVETAPEDLTPLDFAKKREKEESKTTFSKESEAHHKLIEAKLTAAIHSVRSAWMEREEFKSTEGKEDSRLERWCGKLEKKVIWRSKEDEAKELSEVPFISIGLSSEVKKMKDHSRKLCYIGMDGHDTPIEEYYNRIAANPEGTYYLPFVPEEDEEKKVLHFATNFPEGSRFLMSDFSTWSKPASGIAKEGMKVGGFDLVVIDPPWPNTSVKRSDAYPTFDPYNLGKLKLPALLGDKACLVAVWVTNKVKYRRLIIDKLFPSWGIDANPSEWYWVKITSEGEPVWNLNSDFRRCYEGLIVGMYNPKKLPKFINSIPKEKVFLGVPIGHSRKPILNDLLRPYMPNPKNRAPNVLELFARTTLAGLQPSEPASGEAEGEEEEEEEEEEIELDEDEEEEESYEGRGIYLAAGLEPLKFNVHYDDFHEYEPEDYPGGTRCKGYVGFDNI